MQTVCKFLTFKVYINKTQIYFYWTVFSIRYIKLSQSIRKYNLNSYNIVNMFEDWNNWCIMYLQTFKNFQEVHLKKNKWNAFYPTYRFYFIEQFTPFLKNTNTFQNDDIHTNIKLKNNRNRSINEKLESIFGLTKFSGNFKSRYSEQLLRFRI